MQLGLTLSKLEGAHVYVRALGGISNLSNSPSPQQLTPPGRHDLSKSEVA